MSYTRESIRAMVLGYIKINRPQHQATIAHALDLPVLDVSRALMELARTDRNVTLVEGLIGYITQEG